MGRQYPYIAHLADISEYVKPQAAPTSYPSLPISEIHHLTYDQIYKPFRDKKSHSTFKMPSLDDLFIQHLGEENISDQQDTDND